MTNTRPVGLAYPKGTYRVVPFYWRGDDPLTEQENLMSEYRRVQKDFRLKEQELSAVQKEYDKCCEELDSYDKYALQIANDLGQNSISTTQNAEIRKDISDIQNQIQEIESKIATVKFWITPIELTKLSTEDTTLWPEIESQMRNIDKSATNIDSLKKEISEKIISEKYLYSVATSTEARVASHCRHWLSSQLQKLLNSMNQAKSCKNGVRLTATNELIHSNSEISNLFDQYSSIKLELEEARLTKQLAAFHRKTVVKSSYQTVQELNDVLSMLGSEVIDLHEVRDNCDIESIELEEQRSTVKTSQATSRTPTRSGSKAISRPTITPRNDQK